MDFVLRKKRLESELRRQLNKVILFEMNNDAFQNEFISVTRVKLDKDLALASIFFTLLQHQHKNKVLKKLYQSRFFIRHRLKNKINMGHIPELKFFFDEKLDEQDEIIRLLETNKPS